MLLHYSLIRKRCHDKSKLTWYVFEQVCCGSIICKPINAARSLLCKFHFTLEKNPKSHSQYSSFIVIHLDIMYQNSFFVLAERRHSLINILIQSKNKIFGKKNVFCSRISMCKYEFIFGVVNACVLPEKKTTSYHYSDML